MPRKGMKKERKKEKKKKKEGIKGYLLFIFTFRGV